MSELKANKISPAVGTDLTLGDSGDTFTIPAGATITNSGTATGFGGGKVVQVVNFTTGAVATGTTTVPNDDTIPQNTEGDEYMTLAITPTNASNKLFIQVVAMFSHSSYGVRMYTLLFQDSTANALASQEGSNPYATLADIGQLNHYMTAGTTSATTFKVRLGTHGAGTTTFNGRGGGRNHGGVYSSSITITEISV